jgi:predicted MFS family arabinose efflux permease
VASIISVSLFALANSSDVFLLLQASRAGVSAAFLPLLWSVHHVLKATLSERAGALSDRIDRRWLLGCGWLLYAAIYLVFPRVHTTAGMFVLFGIYALPFALTEGAERAWVIRDIDAATRGRAFGIYYLTTGFSTLAGTLAFGLLFDSRGAESAFAVGGVLAVLAALSLLMPQMKRPDGR